MVSCLMMCRLFLAGTAVLPVYTITELPSLISDETEGPEAQETSTITAPPLVRKYLES